MKIKSLENTFKRNKFDWGSVNAFFKHQIHDLDGNPIIAGKKFSPDYKKSGKLPAVLDNKNAVVGELIPYTSWGSSLSNMLTRDSWNALRLPLIVAHKHVCELCGIRLNSLEVHEMWSFETPSKLKKEGFGIQKLERLVAVCSGCHRCFHLGRETALGTIEETLSRLAALNNWEAITTNEYRNEVFRRWERNSELNWKLDMSNIAHPHGFLTINEKWTSSKQNRNMLIRKDGGNNITEILNQPWKLNIN